MQKNQKNDEKNVKITKKTKKIDKKDKKSDIINALTKKAMGFKQREIIEEFSLDENENERLIKKKITTKKVPPDVTAVKVLLELKNMEQSEDLSSLSDEELDEKIDEILKKIREEKDDNND